MGAIIEYDIRGITREINDWLQTVYPDRHPDRVWEKLQEELKELRECPTNAFEWADVLILVFDLMDMYGLDPAKAIHWKMDINKKRQWEMREGKLHHVRPDTKTALQSRICRPLADSKDS